MLEPDDVRPATTAALGRLFAHVDAEAAPGELADAVRGWARLKAERGGKALAEATGLHEQELRAFEAVLRDVERTEGALAPEDPQSRRNAVIAMCRALAWIETIERRADADLMGADVEALVSQDVGQKQVRALELIVRSLITERHVDQARLTEDLRAALGDRVMDGVVARADPGDVLSGLTFGELSSLFVSKSEFARHADLYDDTPFLTLLKQKRRTIQTFLDDVRRVRNTLAHNRKVSNTQLTLLDLYYEELASPVQSAFDQGETKVDPARYLEVDRADLEGYVAGIGEDVQEVRDEIASLKDDLTSRLGLIADDTAAIRETTTGIDKRLLWIGAGVVVLLVIGLFALSQGDETQDVVEETRETAARTEAVATTTAERVEEATTEVRETATETKEVVEETQVAVAETKAAADEAKTAAETATASAERVVKSLDELKDGFAALADQGGIIADADDPAEHYHNARTYQARGESAKAMQSYRDYFASRDDLAFIDPHLRYQSLLKLQNGLGGARELYFEMKEAAANQVTDFAWRLLLDPSQRVEMLDAYVEAHPDYAPAHYALSREFSAARVGVQALDDKRREKEHLERFIELQADSAFLSNYLDQGVAAEHLEDARERLAALDSVAASVLENPVSITAFRTTTWMVVVTIADNAKEILWRKGADGAFESTGHQPIAHPVTGLPLPNMQIELPLATAKTVLQFKYVDPKDREHGPYDVTFDPDALLVESTKHMLRTTRSSWVMLREYDGKLLLYFSGLLTFRGALSEIRYGLDTDTPDKTFPFKPADPKNPNAMRPDDVIYLSIPRDTTYVTVQLRYKDGTTSDIERFEK